MKSPTITTERTAALVKLEEYEQAAAKNPQLQSEADREIAAGYRALARGKRLIDVNAAIAAGGFNLAGQPKLAIARADVDSVRWHFDSAQHVFYWRTESDYSGWDSRTRPDNWRWVIKSAEFEGKPRLNRPCQARTPHIPLPLRPKFRLSNYFLLWEANWTPAPPIDPYLLRPVTGSLMEILAEWDLTPLELAVVAAQQK